jgi:hypothetical protein
MCATKTEKPKGEEAAERTFIMVAFKFTAANSQYILRSQSLAWPDGKFYRLATPVAARTACSAKAPQTSGWTVGKTLHTGGPLRNIFRHFN